MILFGAGASYGADRSGTPPLGGQLFQELQRYNLPSWGKLPTSLSSQFAADFEVGMTELARIHPHWMPPLQRAMAAYFFEFYPNPTNLYVELARRIKYSTWRGALATLNYERLLEISILRQGLQPIVGGLPTTQNQVELCFPHGCCHLFCDSVTGISSGVSFMGNAVTTNGQIRVISNPAEFTQRISNDAFPPVMSYFEPEKRTTAGANFIEAQRNRFAELIRNAPAVVVIGVRVRTNDRHIWEPIAKTSAKIIYCSGKAGGNEFDVWRNNNRTGRNDVILPGYFKESLDDICKLLGI